MALKYDFLASQLREITMPFVLIRKFISQRVTLVSQVSLVLSSKVRTEFWQRAVPMEKKKKVFQILYSENVLLAIERC